MPDPEDSEATTQFDREWRIQAVFPDTRRDVDGPVVVHTSLVGGPGCLLHVDGDGSAVRRELAYFTGIGQDVEWPVFDHDPPQHRSLAESLQFRPVRREVVLVRPAVGSFPRADVVRIRAPGADLDAAIEIQERARSRALPALRWRLTEWLKECPDRISVFLVRDGAAPAASGWLLHPPSGKTARLHGGAVHPGCRGRGSYRTLMAARVARAAQAGATRVVACVVEADRWRMQELGFTTLTGVTHYRYRVPCPL